MPKNVSTTIIEKMSGGCPPHPSHKICDGIYVTRMSDLPCEQCRVDFFAENLAYAIKQYDKVRKSRPYGVTCSYWGKAIGFYGWALELARKEIAENAETESGR